jgi:WhiB family redox-sensing transcriptional regulator
MSRHQYTLTAVSTAVATDWRVDAACRGADPELFFPPPLGAKLAPLMRQIRELCGTCPVRDQCLQFVLDFEGDARLESRYGIFAGTTPRQRWAMWRCTTGRCQHPHHQRDYR